MPGRLLRFGSALTVALVSLFAPAAAHAEWTFAMYFGKQHTAPATVSIDQPSLGTKLDFHDVVFNAHPLKWPFYYGGRLTWLRPGGRWGLEIEFLHSKMYSRTSDVVHVTGTLEHASVDGAFPMNTIVQRFNMTHGHNFILLNLVMRRPIGGGDRVALVARGGAGPTFQGVDSVVGGVSVQSTADWSGVGAQGAAGVTLRVAGRFSILSEYKVTFARPTISIAQGTGHVSALTQQVILGASLRLSR